MGERFRVGRVVARSFAIWARELPLLLAIALVVHAPRVAAVELVGLAMPWARASIASRAGPGSSWTRWTDGSAGRSRSRSRPTS